MKHRHRKHRGYGVQTEHSTDNPDGMVNGPFQQPNGMVFKSGGWIGKAAASIKRRGTAGKCTPMTKPGCTGRALALAKTFHKIARNRHEEGGIAEPEQYNTGGAINSWINPNPMYDHISYNRIGHPQFGYGGLINDSFTPSIGVNSFSSQLGPMSEMEIPSKKQHNPGVMKRGGRVMRYASGGATSEQDFMGNSQPPSNFNKNVNYTSTLPAVTYGVSQGVKNDQINYTPQQGGPSTSQSLVGSTGAWGSAISSGSQLGTSLFGGTDKSNTSNAISTGVFDPAQNLNVWSDPNFNTTEKIYAQVNPFYYGFENNKRSKQRMEQSRRPQVDPNFAMNSVNANYSYGDGGQTPTTMINIEGNELMANPKGTIVRDFKHYPPHPENGTNPMGDVVVPEGHTIIPKNRRSYFQDSSRDSRKTILKGLQVMQQNRDNAERMYADGGNTLGDYNYDPAMFAQNYMSGNAYTAQPGNQSTYTQGTNVQYPDYGYGVNVPGKNYGPVGPRMEGGVFNTAGNPNGTMPRTGQSPNWRGYGNTAMEYAPAAYNIGMGLFDKVSKLNPTDYYTRPITANHVSDEDSLREINTGYYTGLNNLKNSGNYGRRAQIQLAAERMKASAASRERIGNSNAEIDNRTAQQNAEIDARNKGMKFNVEDWNAKSKAAKRNQLDQGIGQLSDLSVQDRYGREERDAIKYYYPSSYEAKGRRKRRGGKI